MARIISNDLTKGLSGIVGEDLCFRQIGGRTFVVKRPRKRPSHTKNQGKQRSRFSQAVYYAKIILADPVKREIYSQMAKEANLRSAYLAAMQDALRNPEISSVFLEAYHGRAGDLIVIDSPYPHKIADVEVEITRADGTFVERGNAVRDRSFWMYKTTCHNQPVIGSPINLMVKDHLRKTTSKVLILDG